MRSDHSAKPIFVRCIENKDCEDLETRKIYQVLAGQAAEKEGCLRIVDESGEGYLCPSSYFVPITHPNAAIKAVRRDWVCS